MERRSRSFLERHGNTAEARAAVAGGALRHLEGSGGWLAKSRWLLAASFVVVAATSFFFFTQDRQDEVLFRELGGKETATISQVEQRSRKDADGDTHVSCQITYVYTVAGEDFTASLPAWASGYCSADVGDEIAISYDPADPTVSTVQDSRLKKANSIPWWGLVLAFGLLGVSVRLAWNAHTFRTYARRLKEEVEGQGHGRELPQNAEFESAYLDYLFGVGSKH